ncbi:MAG TPA: poly-gamma-glutamate synthase PgsB [Nitrososphaerales archaeon]|nr:poly-gamma-glutamate synthase PgsB [Nitrososphaerales archaeon]
MIRKFSARQGVILAFGIAFLLIWLPRTFPVQFIVSALFPIYSWLGLDHFARFIAAPGVFVGSILLLLSAVLVREYSANSIIVGNVPIRIHVTGIRGKSTTTRLIGAALRHSGLRVITKTTGKDARLTDENGVEHRIREHHEQPNLREQPRLLNKTASKGGIDAIVFECMSIRPKNIVAESRFIEPTISVITNVRTDHLDVMGPTLEDAAWSLSGIIRKNTLVVTAEKKYLPIIQKKAEEKNAKVYVSDDSSVPDELPSRFPYMVFKENIAIALEVCSLLGIPRETAIEGMLEAKPDPGLTQIFDAMIANQSVRLVSAFGVNDIDSTKIVLEELKGIGVLETRDLIGLFHARDDRITRTLEFARGMAKIPFKEIICVGRMTDLFVAQASKEGYPRDMIVDLGQVNVSEIFHYLELTATRNNRPITIFGCGNMIGIEEFIREFGLLSAKGEFLKPQVF